MNLFEKYGFCLLPKNTYLFRTGKISRKTDCLFFFLTFSDADGFSQDSNVQVWKTRANIKLLFMIRELNRVGQAKSAVVEIFNQYYKRKNIGNDVALKQNIKTRMKLINKLKQDRIVGWLSSVEDKTALEICLFDDILYKIKQENNVELINVNANYHALNFIKILPSHEFYKNTLLKLGDNAFSEYNKMVDENIADACSAGSDYEKIEKDFYNLRLKLQI